MTCGPRARKAARYPGKYTTGKPFHGARVALCLALALWCLPAFAGPTERVSLSSGGQQWSGPFNPLWQTVSTSADGRFVAFDTEAATLVPGDTNDAADVFVRDRQTGQTERVSVSTDSEQGNAGSWRPAISGDGRFVAFLSFASNLVAGDVNGRADVFIRDRARGTTELVSVSFTGGPGAGHSWWPAISADGRIVAFESDAPDLVAGDTNGCMDIFLRDRETGTTARVSVSTEGEQANGESFQPALSPDGRFVAFMSHATNLVSGDTNDASDIFVHDRVTGVTVRASVSTDGEQADGDSRRPAISLGGRFVAFESAGTNLVADDANDCIDVFVCDLVSGVTERVSVSADGQEGSAHAFGAAISADGRFVAFESAAPELVEGDNDGTFGVFVRDRRLGTTELASVSGEGDGGDGASGAAAMSGDGLAVAYWSLAANLVEGDTNACIDVFVHEREGPVHMLVVNGEHGHITANATPRPLPWQGRFPADSAILMEAIPDACYSFEGWTGDLAGPENPVVFGLDRPMAVTAVFAPRTVTLTVSAGGSGEGQVWVNHVARPLPWSASYPCGTPVVLEAVAGPCSEFGQWLGEAASLDNPLFVELAGDLAVQARFDALGPYLVRITASGEGAVRMDDVAIALPFEQTIACGTTLALEAEAGECHVFRGWSGAVESEQSAVMLTVDGPADVVAHFRPLAIFSDVGCEHWAVEEVAACAWAGVVVGYVDGSYRPEEPVSRAQMAVYISRALAGGDAAVPSGPPQATFPDVPPDHWAFRHVEYAGAAAIVQGYDDGHYHPDGVVDRGQMAVYIARALVAPGGDAAVPPPSAEPSFPDITPDGLWAWCYRHVEYVAERGTAQGYPDGHYHPEVVCTRDQMAVYVARAFALRP